MTINIRPVVVEDLLVLQRVCHDAYSRNFGHHWSGDGLHLYLQEQFNDQRLLRELADPMISYCFVVEGEEVVGFVKMKWESVLPGEEGASSCELEKIYILPDQKGKGLGRFALQQMLKEARARGKRLFFLCVIDTNTAAIAFYQRLGFDFHSKTRLDAPLFKEELRGMHRMIRRL